MITIETKKYDREAVKQDFLYEFSKMILCGMEYPGDAETYILSTIFVE